MRLGRNSCGIELILLFVYAIAFAVSVLFFPSCLDFTSADGRMWHVFLKIRLPEAVTASAVGFCLGMSGAVMQMMLNNELASPFTLGISSASAAGAAVSIVLCGEVWTEVFAVAFSFGSFLMIVSVSWLLGGSRKNIVIAGISANFLFDSIRSIVLRLASPDNIYDATFWSMGSLTMTGLDDSLRLLALFAATFLAVCVLSGDIGLVQQGDDVARMHGVEAKSMRIALILLCSVVTALSVSFVGIIGFAGLVSPHAARLLRVDSPRAMVFSSSLVGATFLLTSDILSKAFTYPVVLPISSVASAFGLLVLIPLALFSRGRRL